MSSLKYVTTQIENCNAELKRIELLLSKDTENDYLMLEIGAQVRLKKYWQEKYNELYKALNGKEKKAGDLPKPPKLKNLDGSPVFTPGSPAY